MTRSVKIIGVFLLTGMVPASAHVLSQPASPAGFPSEIEIENLPTVPENYPVVLPTDHGEPTDPVDSEDGGLTLGENGGQGIGIDPTVIMPAGPLESGEKILEIAQQFQAGCSTPGSYSCIRANELKNASNRMLTAAGKYSNCGNAAADFRRSYRTGLPSDEIAIRYDLECLGSFVPRLGDGPIPLAEQKPQMLMGESGISLLSTIGLLEVGGKPRCAGLLKSPNLFITAKHCLKFVSSSGVKVSAVNGSFAGSRAVRLSTPQSNALGVPGDWVAFRLSEIGHTEFAKTNLTQLTEPKEVNIVAWYPFHKKTLYSKATSSPLKQLRFQRAGLCQAIESSSGCLQIVCQTIRGFSGAPIFSGRKGDGSFDVVGFVSGNDGANSRCVATEDIPNSTMAVSAELIKFGG